MSSHLQFVSKPREFYFGNKTNLKKRLSTISQFTQLATKVFQHPTKLCTELQSCIPLVKYFETSNGFLNWWKNFIFFYKQIINFLQ